MKKKIYCFDFDGTLTTSDTLLEFIRYAKGTGRFLMVFPDVQSAPGTDEVASFSQLEGEATHLCPSFCRHAYREV